MNTLKKYLRFFHFGMLALLLLQFSCKKLVEVPPPVTAISGTNVNNNDATAISVLTGIYTNLSSSNIGQGGITSLSFFPSLSSDELTLFTTSNQTYTQYYTNNLSATNTQGSDFWSYFYPVIYTTNSAIIGLNAPNSLTPVVKQQLLGEAKFMRAFCYFYLVNLYGDVPLVIGVDYKANGILARTPKVQVWQQIIADLRDAQSLLSANYLDGTLLSTTPERYRPTKWAATALLARAYLYYANLSTSNGAYYTKADSAASAVISNTSTFSLSSLDNAFLDAGQGNNEAIWQLQPVISGQNTWEAMFYILPSSGPGDAFPVYLSPSLISAFELGDRRKTEWVNSVTDTINGTPKTFYYAWKYKVNVNPSPVTESEMVLRLAEQYLIKAECEAHGEGSGNAGAVADLNVIRERAMLPDYTGPTDQESLMGAILRERRVEFFTEWAHRWLDLKRTGMIDNVMNSIAPAKGASWNTNKQWYPLPASDLHTDPNLVQNAGY
jgi:hypothetical protein